MTLAQIGVTESHPEPARKLHWLAEQALNWSGLRSCTCGRPVLLEGFFLILTPESVGRTRYRSDAVRRGQDFASRR